MIVHPKVSFGESWLTKADLGRIYRGEVESWKDRGGPDTPIVPLVSPKSPPPLSIRSADRKMVTTVGRTRGAIGFVSYGVRVVPGEGTGAPGSKKYPLVRPLYLWRWKEAGNAGRDLVTRLMHRDAQCHLAKLRLRAAKPGAGTSVEAPPGWHRLGRLEARVSW